MKIAVTGSLGNISKPLTIELLQKGHEVTVISSNAGKRKEIEALGASAAIGSLDDEDFITSVFTGKDAVYTMIPPNNYFDHTLDLPAYYERLARNYEQAVNKSAVKRLVHLSSIGAHLKKGNGILASTHVVEQILGRLSDVTLTFIRPTSFYYNLLGYINGIKTEGLISANYGTQNIIPWVSPIDIAATVAEELTATAGTLIRYVASEELNGDDTAKVLGTAIGIPDLKWKLISDEEALNGLLTIGMNPSIAAGLVEMYGALQTGLLSADYYCNRPEKMGTVKLADYAKEFAAVYNSQC
ncbi:NAD(P)H-binding protein [Arcticibacter tournemirensis]|uniref:NAD-dependent dehydratase n=1 Tax=Arcticibacter tournemirensis TaxID=699437 RepID=A0A4Q0M7E1_9SPHI|nr:NAD(P)H-binding protein [Arcticibacter tournemirensis]RXF68944.1 NAD-dependent dehydratase [Arcticibacter tournemirensis]